MQTGESAAGDHDPFATVTGDSQILDLFLYGMHFFIPLFLSIASVSPLREAGTFFVGLFPRFPGPIAMVMQQACRKLKSAG
jgi:hypothetical protein